MFIYVHEASCKVSYETDSVWSGYDHHEPSRRPGQEIRTQKREMSVGIMFIYVHEATRKVSSKTDSVWASHPSPERPKPSRAPRAVPRKIPDPKTKIFFWDHVYLGSRGHTQNFVQNRLRLGLLPKIMTPQKINVSSCHLANWPICIYRGDHGVWPPCARGQRDRHAAR